MVKEHLVWSLYLFDIGYYVLTFICLRYAIKQGFTTVLTLMSGNVFGFIIEYFAVVSNPPTYQYNFFIVKLPGPVPLGAVLGWGLIFFAVTEVAKLSKLPWYAQPLYAGLLATCIDLFLDPIVVFIGFWTWKVPVQWFGIPWANYTGWVVIVGSFAFFQQLGYKRFPPGEKKWRDFLIAFGAAIPAFAVVYAFQMSFLWLSSQPWVSQPLLVGIIFGIFLSIMASFVPKIKRDNSLIKEVLMVPGFFAAWSLPMLYISGLDKAYQPLVLVFPAIMFLTALGFIWPSLDNILKKWDKTQSSQ